MNHNNKIPTNPEQIASLISIHNSNQLHDRVINTVHSIFEQQSQINNFDQLHSNNRNFIYPWDNNSNEIRSSAEQLDIDKDTNYSHIIPLRGTELTLPKDFDDASSVDSDILSQLSEDDTGIYNRPQNHNSYSLSNSSRSSSRNSREMENESDDLDDGRKSVDSFNVSNISPPSSTFKTFSKVIQWERHSYTLRESLPDSTTEAQWNEIVKNYLAVLNDIPGLAGVNHLTLSLDKKSETMKVIIPSSNQTFDIQNQHVKKLLNIYPFPLSTCLVQLSSSDDDGETDISKSSDTGSLKRYKSSPEKKPSAEAVHQSESSSK